VGYNPLRRYRGGKAVDLTIMVSSLLVIVALLIWAIR
jgi:hypothetical protein